MRWLAFPSNSTKSSIGSLALLFGISLASSPVAAINLDTSDLPPDPDLARCETAKSFYQSDEELHALFPGGIDFTDVVHSCFVNVVVSTDSGTGDETENFDSTVTGVFDDGSGPQLLELQGPVEIVTRARGGAQTGSWDTEIVAMSLSGNVGGVSIDIRESPSQPSIGHTSIANGPGGTFEVDSFFDVFIEISINGGPFQSQINGASRMTLRGGNPVVPSSGPMGLIVLMAALVASGAVGWRRMASMKD